jgi:hypothetical protein
MLDQIFWVSSMAITDAARSATERSSSTGDNHLRAPPANYITSPQDPVAPSPVASDTTTFEDVDEDFEEEGTEKGSVAGDALNFDTEQRPEVTSPLREGLRTVATPLRVFAMP